MIVENGTEKTVEQIAPLPKPVRLSLDAFQAKTLIGQGSFGRIFLSIETTTSSHFAIKQLRKIDIIKMKQIDHLRNEIYILNSIKHPFIIEMKGFTQNARNIYIVMEYIAGGELFSLLREEGQFGKAETSFYASNVILALEYLHSCNVIYRDLKPENLLIGTDGYLRLSDFGFAKVITNRTYTLCGTPEYVAPEVIRNTGHGKGADWWSLGILLYEMLVGIDPFNADSPMETFKRILRAELIFPEKFLKDAKSLIKHLLERDLSKRYGNLINGFLNRGFGYQNASFFRSYLLGKYTRKEWRCPL